ncbi:MAG: sugar phosphate isomerase/epimerase family protein [Planctomycetaceae bacterium]
MIRLDCLTLSYSRLFGDGPYDVFRFLDICRELSLDGVALHADSLSGADRATLKRVRRRCLDLGLSISCFCVSTDFASSADAVPAQIEKARAAMEIGMFLGAPLVRVFVGAAPSPDLRDAAFARSVKALRTTAEIGAELGMPVALQNHSGLTSTGDDMLQFYKEVDHPNFSLVLDTGHFAGRQGPGGPFIKGLTYEDYYRSLEQVAPLATFVRVKLYEPDAEGRERWIDYNRVFNILRSVHYNGFVSLVYEGQEDPTQAVPRGVGFLRRVMTG